MSSLAYMQRACSFAPRALFLKTLPKAPVAGPAYARSYSATRICSKLQTGIVGMPNVGKSTLFNALTGGMTAQAANFPFCTIDPNVGMVSVPDPRLQVLTTINKSQRAVPATLEFVDIAGLVKGASKGEGLGNQFLANIRQVDAIVHVVRCFLDDNIIHVDGTVDPLRDIEVINLELILADLAQVEKRLERVKKDKKAVAEETSALDKLMTLLADAQPARKAQLSDDEKKAVKSLGLLTTKPVLYAANVADSDMGTGNELATKVFDFASNEGNTAVLVSAQVESELVELDPEEKKAFLDTLGIAEDDIGLPSLVRKAYATLGLRTYYTSGEKETRAWTINAGMTAPQAAGVIHGDFERGFIRAETIGYDDLVRSGSEKAAKENGLMRSEGKDYVVQDGDVILFRFNV